MQHLVSIMSLIRYIPRTRFLGRLVNQFLYFLGFVLLFNFLWRESPTFNRLFIFLLRLLTGDFEADSSEIFPLLCACGRGLADSSLSWHQ